MKITVVDNAKGDWRRVYVDQELVYENHPMRLNLVAVLRTIASRGGMFTVDMKKVENFEMLEESGGVAIA